MQFNITAKGNIQITCQHKKYGDLLINKSIMKTQEG